MNCGCNTDSFPGLKEKSPPHLARMQIEIQAKGCFFFAGLNFPALLNIRSDGLLLLFQNKRRVELPKSQTLVIIPYNGITIKPPRRFVPLIRKRR